MGNLQATLMEEGVLHEPLSICTEHKRDGQIFWGSPNYRRRGAWNDWVKVDWGPGYGCLPCELWCFIDLSHLPDDFELKFEGSIVKRGTFAVVESSTYSTNEEEIAKSELFTPLTKDFLMTEDGRPRRREFYMADVDAIVSTTIVVPDVGCENGIGYLELLPMDEWANIFVRSVEAKHTDDVIEDDPEEMEEEEAEVEDDEDGSGSDAESSDEEEDESEEEDDDSDQD